MTDTIDTNVVRLSPEAVADIRRSLRTATDTLTRLQNSPQGPSCGAALQELAAADKLLSVGEEALAVSRLSKQRMEAAGLLGGTQE